MRKITEFSVNYPVTVVMLVAAVLLLGLISFQRLGIDLFPDLNNPRLYIEIKAGERPPEEMETQYVEAIESQAIRQKKVIQVSSRVTLGTAQITVEYAWDMDMDEAFLDLQKTMTALSQNSDLEEMTISQHDPNADPVMLIAVTHREIMDPDDLRRTAENYIRNELIRIEGIADVELSGQLEKEVVIDVDSYRLQAHGLTPDDISAQIQNMNRSVSGGSIVDMGVRYVIKGVSQFESLDDIKKIIVAYMEQSEKTAGTSQLSWNRVPLYLEDIAEVRFDLKEPENIVRLNGARCLGLSIYKETQFNTVNAVGDLIEALQEIKKALPGYEFTIIHNQGEFIQEAIDEVKQSALYGILLAVAMLFIFLRRLGTTLIISFSIPVSIVATFNLMYFNGLSLNIMTLGGLALGAGMLVDNAIVVMENIFRHLESGASIREAAIEGTAQVGGAITASTATTLVVFLPIVYLHSTSGALFKDQAWTVAFSLLSSLVVALLVIPMLSSRFLAAGSGRKKQKSIRFRGYDSVLERALKNRWGVVLSAAALVGITILILPHIGSEFIPKADTGSICAEIKLKPGTNLLRTESSVQGIESLIRSLAGEQIQTLYSRVGPSQGLSADESSIFEDENTAEITVILKPDRANETEEVISLLSTRLAAIPDMEVQVSREETALQTLVGTETAPIIVEVKGEDLDQIESLTGQIKRKMTELNGVLNIRTSFEEGAPEVEVSVDRLQAGLYSIGVSSISSQLQDQLAGVEAGEWQTRGELMDITLRLPDVALHELEILRLRAGSQEVLLGELADLQIGQSPREIHRRNQTRIGRVTAQIESGVPFDHVVGEIEGVISTIDFPDKYSAQVTGEEEKRRQSFASLRFALLLSIILVYMVLASQFESLMLPFVILLTIPLAGVGAVWIFLVLGRTLNIMALIGIIMLGGIAVNNSIILLDTINQLRRSGVPRRKAILAASQQRIRPIVMTSLTTILALFPLTLGFGEGSALRSPMALAVIGGLFTSTAMTLVVIPCLYSLLDQGVEKLKRT